MNTRQEQRYAKLRTDKFYLLGHEIKDDNLLFHISGSTKNVYTVTIHPKESTIFCTCPDAKSWAVKCKCVCKHALFILYRVLKVFDRKEHPFFDRLRFLPDEMECIQLSTEYLQSHLDNTVVNSDLTNKFKTLSQPKSNTGSKPIVRFDADDICGVCFDDLDSKETDKYIACPKCHKFTHTDCLNKWTSSGQKMCVYCRQEVWGKNNNSLTKAGYQNLE